MKREFKEPSFDVVRFGNNVIATSGCACVVAGVAFENNETQDTCPYNYPGCQCGNDVSVNCCTQGEE